MDDWHWNLLFFQMMFAATATTIASGAMAQRIHFVAYIVSAAVVSGFDLPDFWCMGLGSLFDGEGWLKAYGLYRLCWFNSGAFDWWMGGLSWNYRAGASFRAVWAHSDKSIIWQDIIYRWWR